MAVAFTPEQQKAIDLHGANILVSAAAGSGKTAVLAQRIVQMVCREEDPLDIDRLLVVTFTKAAAAEMRERISRAIMDRLNEDSENEHLQRQSALLHNAQITTIDSFCLFVLRNNFQDIGLDPAFRVADEGELELLRQDVLASLLEEKFAEGSQDFYECVEYFCPNGRESVLEGHIFELLQYALSFPFPEQWLRERKRDYEIRSVEELEDSEWGKYLLRHLQKMVKGFAETMARVQRICELPDGPYMYGELVEKEKEMLEALCDLSSLSAFEEKLSAVTFGRLPSKKDDSVSPQEREVAKIIREDVKDGIKKLNESYFSMPVEAAIRQSESCSRAIGELVDLVLLFMERLQEQKRDKKIMDFSDMEHCALQILIDQDEDGRIIPTRTALEYRDYFKEVLIDEYQDSNLVQEYLLWAVSGEEAGSFNRFMVGDVKQSIYKFRLARPDLFLEKYTTYTPDGDCCRIDLHKNFRSRVEVINTVNTVFSQIMTKELGGIVYDDGAALYPGATYPDNTGCESEFWIYEKPGKESDISSRQAEAMGIARRIKELMRDFSVTDKETGKLRPVTYRDMVVLLRAGSGWDTEFKNVFASEGIPAYVTGNTGYFATREIQDILQFLRVLDNPLQDIPLFGAMKSVFGGFTDEELARIKSSTEDGLFKGVQNYSENGEDEEIRQKCQKFVEQLAKYRNYTTYMPILELLQTLLSEYDYLSYVAALPEGGQRLANVEMLLTKAAGFEKNSYYGLFHFIRYIEHLEKYNVDYGEASTLSESADVVRIMSIHKSKGLEFPIAFVAGMSKRFNMQDTTKSLITDVDLGLGVDYVNQDLRVRSKTMRKNILAEKMRLDNLAEELRILYVAMTRAKEKLILTAVAAENQTEKLKARTDQEPSYVDLCQASSFLDYLIGVFPGVQFETLEEATLLTLEGDIAGIERQEELSHVEEYADTAWKKELESRFSYLYPHKNLEKLYTKTTVSELKMAALEEKGEEPARELFPENEPTIYIPRFMQEKEEVSGTVRGSAMHRVMELLDLQREYPDVKAVRDAIERFRQEGRITEEYAKAARPEKILIFLQSPLGQRMKKADEAKKLHREQPFVFGIGADRLSDSETVFPAEETVLIQGIVDAYFEEEDGVVLVDYKTDVIKESGELIRRYETQLQYYEEALKSLTDTPVKERILYSFYLECEVKA